MSCRWDVLSPCYPFPPSPLLELSQIRPSCDYFRDVLLSLRFRPHSRSLFGSVLRRPLTKMPEMKINALALDVHAATTATSCPQKPKSQPVMPGSHPTPCHPATSKPIPPTPKVRNWHCLVGFKFDMWLFCELCVCDCKGRICCLVGEFCFG